MSLSEISYSEAWLLWLALAGGLIWEKAYREGFADGLLTGAGFVARKVARR